MIQMSITRISSFPAIRILGSRFPRTFQWPGRAYGIYSCWMLERELVGRVTTQVNVWVNRHIGKCVARHEINGYIVGDPYSRSRRWGDEGTKFRVVCPISSTGTDMI